MEIRWLAVRDVADAVELPGDIGDQLSASAEIPVGWSCCRRSHRPGRPWCAPRAGRAGSGTAREKLLGIGDVPSGDLLLQVPDISGQRLHEVLLLAGHRGDDRMGQLERRRRPEAAGLDSLKRLAGLAQGDVGVDRRIDRPWTVTR